MWVPRLSNLAIYGFRFLLKRDALRVRLDAVSLDSSTVDSLISSAYQRP